MKKLSLGFIPLILLVSSCTQSIKCDLEDGLEGTISYAIEKLGNCSGTDAVRKSVNTWVDSAGVCSNDGQMKAGSGVICGVIISSLVTMVGNSGSTSLNSKFPDWKCDLTATVSALETLANAACGAVFPIALAAK